MDSSKKSDDFEIIEYEPDWVQEGISKEEWFEKHFSNKDVNFILEKPQKQKTPSHWGNKLVLFSLIFMFIFSGWLILENTVQRDKIAYFETKIASLQEDYDALSAEYEKLSSTHIKTESQMLKYKQQIENSAANKTSSTQKENSGFRDVTNKIVNNAAKNNTQTQNIPYKQNYHGAVYITRTGKCYHYESPCGRGTYYEATWAQVNSLGLEPCGKCVLK